MAVGDDIRRDRRSHENDDDPDREEGRDAHPLVGNHLECGEGKDCGEAVVKVAEADDQLDDSDIQGSQTENGKNIGAVDKKRIAGDGEGRRNGVSWLSA